jgi:predicted nucleic acid-binding protein
VTDRTQRVFLDTNIYIIGILDPASAEARILQWVGFGGARSEVVEVVVSEALFDEISRVAKRLRNKDWAGEILARIWQNLNLHYTLVDSDEVAQLVNAGFTPTEDIEVYLTARNGQAHYFVSANHELIHILAQRTGEFVCLTPAAFVAQNIK